MKALIQLDSLQKAVQGRIRAVIPSTVSVQGFMMLETIYNERNCSLNAVCESVGITSSSGSRIIRDLKKAELIKSKPCEDDKRNVCLSVTTEGGKLYRKHQNKAHKAARIHLTDLNHVAAIIGGQDE